MFWSQASVRSWWHYQTLLPPTVNRDVSRCDRTLNADTGADWEQFNKEHVAFRRNTVLLYGNKRQLYKQYQLLLAATSHAALPLFGVQARTLISHLARILISHANLHCPITYTGFDRVLRASVTVFFISFEFSVVP